MRRLICLTILLWITACAGDDDATSDGADASDGDTDFVQPGLDDPTARQWEKAGGWYPEDHQELDDEIAALLEAVEDPGEPRPAAAVLVPHASLKFSGPTAAELFARVALPDTLIMLAPDHWGDDTQASIWTEGPWLVPGHAIEVDSALVAKVQDAIPDLESSRVAFSHHESEMMLPWIQFLRPDAKIVPISIYDNSKNDFPNFDVERIHAFGLAIADVVRAEEAAGRSVLILTTTDLVHHETLALADEQDAQMMTHITELDVEGLYDYVNAESITIGGEIVTAIMMSALTELGYDSMDLVALGDSLHANSDDTDVIGYPAAAAWKD